MSNPLDKLLEHEGRLNEMSHDLESIRDEPKKKMTMFKVIAIEFKPNQYRVGEDQVNRNLSQGFEITKDFQTESGIVVVMTKWADKKEPKKEETPVTFADCQTKEGGFE